MYILSVSTTLVVLVAVIINLVLPMIVKPFATSVQINPPKPGGAAALGFFDQIMHMLVHHSQVPFTSSLIVALITLLSVIGAFYLTNRIKTK